MMPKNDTIKEIRRLNPSANPAFLEKFSEGELQKYLLRLWEMKDDAFSSQPSAARQ